MRIHQILHTVLACCVAIAAAAQTAYDHNAEGVANYNAGRFDEAIMAFEKAYELAPDNAVVRLNLCNARQGAANKLAKGADFAGAAEHLELAIGIDPENPAPLLQLGSYYMRLDMVYDAIFRLEEAVQLAPTNVTGHDLLGDAYYMDNDKASALEQWHWVAEVQPGRKGIHDKIAKAARQATVESGFRPSGSRHFQISYDPAIPVRVVRQVRSILERAYVEIGRNFGGVQPPPPVQVIIYDRKGFADATMVGTHVGALYDGKIRIPLMDLEGRILDQQTLKERLYHEYTHVVVKFLTGANTPWWLNEGLAETFSREIGPDRAALLDRAIEGGLLFPLAAIEGNQLATLDRAALQLAYAQSHATVQHLWDRFGQHRLADLMGNLAEGMSAEDALYQNYRRTYDTLQKEATRAFTQTRSRVVRK